MSFGLRQVVYDSPRTRPAMKRMVDRLENLQGVAPAAHRIIVDHVKTTFKSEGTSVGKRWPSYTGDERRYGAIKKKLIGSKRGKMLLRWEKNKERLYPSLVEGNHPEHVWRIEGTQFVFGTKVPYAYRHQFGVGRGPEWAGRPKIKQRQFLVRTRKLAARMRRAYLDYMGLGADGALPGR